MINRIVGRRMPRNLHLFVDGRELNLKDSLKIANHSPDGFNAGYGGSGPAQSALAILLAVLKDKDRASSLYQDFKFEFLTKGRYQNHDFVIEVDIEEWAKAKEKE